MEVASGCQRLRREWSMREEDGAVEAQQERSCVCGDEKFQCLDRMDAQVLVRMWYCSLVRCY